MLLQKYYRALLALPIFAGAPLCEASRNIRFDPRKSEGPGRTTTESHKQRVLGQEKRQNLELTTIPSPTPVRNTDPIIDVGDRVKYLRGRSWC